MSVNRSRGSTTRATSPTRNKLFISLTQNQITSKQISSQMICRSNNRRVFSWLFWLWLPFVSATETTNITGHKQPLGAHVSPYGVTVSGTFSLPQVFHGHFVKTSKPIHMKTVLRDAEHPGLHWTDDYLREHFGMEMVNVAFRKSTLFQHKVENMTLSKFLDVYPHEDLYMMSGIQGSLTGLIKIPSTLQCGGFQKSLQKAVIWMGKGPFHSSLQYDVDDNLPCVFDGVSVVVLVNQTHKKRVESHGFNGEGLHSLLDVESVDMIHFPQFRDLPWHRVRLTAGDCLYIPNRWYHQVSRFGDRSLAISIVFSPLWWFDKGNCTDVNSLPSLKSVDSLGDVESVNEAIRSKWLELFKDADGGVDHQSFLQKVTSGSSKHKNQLFETIDENKDGILQWQELYAFDVKKALSVHADIFFDEDVKADYSDLVDDTEFRDSVTQQEDSVKDEAQWQGREEL